MRGPTDEAWRSELLQAICIGCIGLGGVGGDDFKIMPVAERKQRVARTAPRMHAAQGGSDPSMLLDGGDASVKVAGAEQDVVEHGGHVNRSPGKAKRGECAPRQGEKRSAG